MAMNKGLRKAACVRRKKKKLGLHGARRACGVKGAHKRRRRSRR